MSTFQIRAHTAFSVALVCGLFLSMWEITALSMESHSESWMMTAWHIVSLNGLFSLGLAIVCSILFPSITQYKPLSWQWFGVGLNAKESLRYTSIAFTLALCLIPYMLVMWISTQIAHSFNKMSLVGAWGALSSLLALLVLVVVWPVVLRSVNYVLHKVCPHAKLLGISISLVPGIIVGLVALMVVIIVRDLPLGAYQLDGYYMILTIIPLYVVCTWVLHRYIRILTSWRAAISMSAILVGLCIWSLPQWSAQSISTYLIPQQAKLSALVLKVARTLNDQDADGYADVLGGGDCDDSNAKVNPAATEIFDNGIDDDCQFGDESKPEPKPVVVPAKVVEEVKKVKPNPWNVLLILVDTMRASHLDLYGYDRPTMPNLTKFSQNAVVFDKAFAHAPRTPFSIPSLLIGRYPSRLSWVKRFSNYSKLKDENETMFERFKKAGWQTEAVSAHWYFGKKKNVNLNQGLDLWDNKGELSVSKSNTQSAAAMITKKLQGRLQALSQNPQKPFFIFAHYFAPHGRYMLHSTRCKRSKKWCHVEPRCKEHESKCLFGNPKARGVEKFINAYDSELAYTDLYLADIFQTLTDLKLDDNTIVVITSDHGESFKDRKPANLFHGRSVYNEELHIPLIIKTPQSKGQRRSEVVGLVDISPTLSMLTGTEQGLVNGLSLAPLLDDDTHDELSAQRAQRVLYLEQLPYPGHKVYMTSAINAQGMKAIRNVTNNQNYLYDLSNDWGEKNNLMRTKQVQQHQPLLRSLKQFMSQTPK